MGRSSTASSSPEDRGLSGGSTSSTRIVGDWRAAERNAAQWMRGNGFSDARQQSGNHDGGVDVRAGKALAQVKHHAHPVGRPALQALVGARMLGTQDLLFFSLSGYTQGAIQYAGDMSIALFTYDAYSGAVRPLNRVARNLAAARIQTAPASRPAIHTPANVHDVSDNEDDPNSRRSTTRQGAGCLSVWRLLLALYLIAAVLNWIRMGDMSMSQWALAALALLGAFLLIRSWHRRSSGRGRRSARDHRRRA